VPNAGDDAKTIFLNHPTQILADDDRAAFSYRPHSEPDHSSQYGRRVMRHSAGQCVVAQYQVIALRDYAGLSDLRTTLTYIRSPDHLSRSPAYVLKY
jgi:hypothetical protein